MVIWIIGKSGAGKSFYGKKIINIIKKRKKIHIDGDEVRKYLSDDLGYSRNDRRENSKRIIKLCKYLENKNYVVVCSILSIFRDHQKNNRVNFNKYIQIFINAKKSTLIDRDKKNIYGRKKNIVGKDIVFYKPYKSDLEINAEDSPIKNLKKIKNIIYA